MILSRSGWTLSTLAGASILMLTPDVASTFAALQSDSFPAALLALGTLCQLLLSAWILLITALSWLGESSRLLRYLAPRFVRRALFVGAAGALTLTPAHSALPLEPHDSVRHSLDGLRLPDRPTVSPSPPSEPVQRTSIFVQPGDTLWAIAARDLPAGATNAQIAAATVAWHSANRAVIGPNPHRIFPGQQFTQPIGKDSS